MKTTTSTVNEPKVSPWFTAVIVSLATFMEVLDTTIVNVALNHIAGNLSATQQESTWVVTSYLITNAIILPISGWLAQVLGRKKYFMFSIGLFTLSSFFCGTANSLVILVFFRLIQGLSGGGLQPLQQAIVLDAFPVHQRGTAFAITGVTIVVAPVLGPTLGGYITDSFNWRWIFFINIPIGIVVLFLVQKFIHDPKHAQAKGLNGKIDFIGLGLISLSLGTLQLILDKGELEDWFESNFIITLSIICFFSFTTGIIWLTKQKDPFIEIALLKNKNFTFACIMMLFTGFILFSSNILLPFLVQTQFNYDAQTAGLTLSPAALVILLIMPIAGRLVGIVQIKYLVCFGFTTTAIGLFYMVHFSPSTDFNTFMLMRILQVMGIPLIFISISTIAYMDIPKEMNNKASAIFSLSRNIGGSIGISIINTVLARHMQIRQSYLSESLTASNTEYWDTYTRIKTLLIQQGVIPTNADNMTLTIIYNELIQQSTLLAYIDCFYYSGIIALCLAPIALLLPSNKSSNKQNTFAH